ncbi:STAS domain-containing protein [Lentzea sp. CA-135723]|uniref:STAS domain-containing protein n=1 Tax=Lentzea sp. CA-135723 TaxID=3239950 RepID=UPI003D8C7DAF
MKRALPHSEDDWSARTTLQDGIPVVTISGDVDAHTAPALNAVLAAQLRRRPAALVVHLGAVSYFDSSGLAVLLDTRELAASQHVPVHLAAISPRVLASLEVTGLTGLFPRHATVREAVRAHARSV